MQWVRKCVSFKSSGIRGGAKIHRAYREEMSELITTGIELHMRIRIGKGMRALRIKATGFLVRCVQ